MTYYEENEARIYSLLYPFRGYGCRVYGFGSAFKKKDPKDLDLLLVFKEGISEKEMTKVREIKDKIPKTLGDLPVNFLVLTHGEFTEESGPVLRNIKKHLKLLVGDTYGS